MHLRGNLGIDLGKKADVSRAAGRDTLSAAQDDCVALNRGDPWSFDDDPNLENLLLAPYFCEAVEKAQPAWRNVVCTAVRLGIPVPAFATALAYYDGYRSARLPANLLQAQRDYFGAHTYRRVDKPGDGPFHAEWLRLRRQPE